MTPTPTPTPTPTSTSTSIDDATDEHHLGLVFWLGLAIGGAVMAFGVRGVLADLGPDNPFKLATWVVGLDLAHDLLLAPAVVILGLLLARVLPASARGPVRAAAGLSGMVVLFSIPLITAWGRRAGNSSTLPLNYAPRVLIVLAAIWVVAGVVIVVRRVRTA